MKVSIHDERIKAAANLLLKDSTVKIGNLSERFEKKYNCKVVVFESSLCTDGYVQFLNEKYYNWFLLQFKENK